MGRIYRLCKIDRSGADRGCLRLPVYLDYYGESGYRSRSAALLTENIGNKYLMLLVINAVLLVAEPLSTRPARWSSSRRCFFRLYREWGIDLLHFGLVMTVNLTIGMCTPPLGVCLFVSGTIAEVS